MINLEGFEIEEMRSINHIMTVELQFKTPVTQKEAREYLTNLLANANGTFENANENVINEENLETKKKQIANAFGVPESVLNEVEVPEAADVKEKPKKEKGKPGPKRGKIDWDKACALKKAGWSNNEIATEVHTSVGTINSMIYQRLKEYNAGKRSERMEEIEHE